jgi:hypothetical protein
VNPSDLILGPTGFSRWGDGEWASVLGHGGANCDGQPYTAGLRDGLIGVLKDSPDYHLGMQRFAKKRHGEAIGKWLAWEAPGIVRWLDADLFHTASRRDEMQSIFEAIATRRVLLVGPIRLSALEAYFPFEHHVVVPAARCFDSFASWSEQAVRLAKGMDRPLVAISAGMPANLLVHRLAREVPDATSIDFGSVWEPYVGHANRSYHAKILERIA